MVFDTRVELVFKSESSGSRTEEYRTFLIPKERLPEVGRRFEEFVHTVAAEARRSNS